MNGETQRGKEKKNLRRRDKHTHAQREKGGINRDIQIEKER